jgi:hypothetical protein
MSELPQVVVEMPLACPRCSKVLYPVTKLRPQPKPCTAGRMMFILAGVAATVIEFVVASALREHLALREFGAGGWEVVRYPPTLVVSMVALPVALVPGFVIGYFASRMPMVRRLRCKECRWSQKYPVGARWERSQESLTTLAAEAVAANRIVNEPWSEATVWAYSELREGRLSEDVAADLIEQGWPRDDVEIMVEAQRRAARVRPVRRT